VAASNEIHLSCFLFMARPSQTLDIMQSLLLLLLFLPRNWGNGTRKLEIGTGCCYVSSLVQSELVCVTQMIKDFILWLLLGCVFAAC